MANVTGSFTATGQSASFVPFISDRSTKAGTFNIALSGTGVASIQLEKSFDNGTTWCQVYGGGTQLYAWSYNSVNLTEQGQETEQDVILRLNCTSYTSGTVTYRISQ
jgi:hypothetical protein